MALVGPRPERPELVTRLEIETLAAPFRDARLSRRTPDAHFVLEAIREEHEAGEEPVDADLGVEVTRHRFGQRPRRAGRPAWPDEVGNNAAVSSGRLRPAVER